MKRKFAYVIKVKVVEEIKSNQISYRWAINSITMRSCGHKKNDTYLTPYLTKVPNFDNVIENRRKFFFKKFLHQCISRITKHQKIPSEQTGVLLLSKNLNLKKSIYIKKFTCWTKIHIDLPIFVLILVLFKSFLYNIVLNVMKFKRKKQVTFVSNSENILRLRIQVYS